VGVARNQNAITNTNPTGTRNFATASAYGLGKFTAGQPAGLELGLESSDSASASATAAGVMAVMLS